MYENNLENQSIVYYDGNVFVSDWMGLIELRPDQVSYFDDDLSVPEVSLQSIDVHSAFPNPFNAGTTIEFSLDRRQRVQVHIYNIAGQVVATLLDKTLGPGSHQVAWDGRTELGRAAASGIYFYQVAGEKETQSKKMLLLK
jgi:hypothetical protein